MTSRKQFEAPVERVWVHLIDPHYAGALQPGVEVLRTYGTDGTVGSGYEVSARQGPLRVQMEVQVAQARLYEEIVVLHKAAGRVVASGHYVLSAGSSGGTRLTVSTSTTGLLARLTRKASQKQQDRWLDRLADLVDRTANR